MECDRKLRCNMFVTINRVHFKGLKCILEDFLNGKFAGPLSLSAAVPSAFSLPAVKGVTLSSKSLSVFDFGHCSNFPAVIWRPFLGLEYFLCLPCWAHKSLWENWGICQSRQVLRESPKPWVPSQKEQAWHAWFGSPGNQSHFIRWGIKSIPIIFICMCRICSLSCPGQRLHLCSVQMVQPQQSQALHRGTVTPSPHFSQPLHLHISLQECWMFIGPDEIKKNRKKGAAMLLCSKTSNLLDIQSQMTI